MLTCQSNRFVDNSANNLTLTRTGIVQTQSFNPLQLNTGQSYYFSGASDYLLSANTPTGNTFVVGTGNFTLEGWVYTQSTAAQGIFDLRATTTSTSPYIYTTNTTNPAGLHVSGDSEFEGDIKRTKYLKKLFRKYKKSNILKERLILNHIILIYNVFGVEAATRILFFRIDERDYDILKTFLLYLNYMPDRVEGINGKNIDSSTIMVDMNIAEILRKL